MSDYREILAKLNDLRRQVEELARLDVAPIPSSLAIYAGTPVAGEVAQWTGTGTVTNAGYAGSIVTRFSGAPTSGAIAIWSGSGTVTADVAYGTTTMPRYSGTPAANDMAYWSSNGVLTKAPFGTAGVARLDVGNAFAGNQSIASGSVSIGGDALAANTFHIGTTEGASALARYVASSAGPGIVLKKSRNASVGNHTVVQNSDEIGKIIFQGSDGTIYRSGAQIVAYVDGTPGTADMPGRIEFQITPDGSATPVVGLTLANDKTLTAAGALTVSGALTFGTAQWTSANHGHIGGSTGGLIERYIKTNILLVDANFASIRPSNCYTTISDALSACAGGETIIIAAGTYTETCTIADHGITLQGSGQPRYDAATGRLVGGTIIRGRIIRSTYVGVTIRDLGVDTYDGTTGVDCINASNPSVYADFTIKNVTCLGKGTADLAHGIYSIGDGATIDNVRVYHCHHGIAVHGSYQNISKIWLYSCGGTTIVLKAKSTNNVHHVNVSDIEMIGEDGGSSNLLSGPLAIQAEDSLSARYINITNVNAINCVNGVVHVILTDVTGEISDVTFTNVQSEANEDLAGVGDFRITTGTNIVFVGCGSNNRDAGYGFVQSGTATDVRVYSSTADTSGSGAYSGTFDVLELNGDFWRPDGVVLSPYTGHRGSRINGSDSGGLISITGANTAIAILADSRNSIANDIGGILFVWARAATTTAGNSASYVLHVHSQYNGTTEVTTLSTLGFDTGSGSTAPSFTFTIDFTTHELRATPIASTTGDFYFSFAAIGHLTVLPL